MNLDTLDFTKHDGVVTVVAQDASTGTVLMVAAADREALAKTIATGEMHYRSRSRGLWHKGATSGNVQRVEGLYPDCDGDTVLALVTPAGPACHTGTPSCFNAPTGDALRELDQILTSRQADKLTNGQTDRPTSRQADKPSYTHRLLADRNLRLKKLGEECAELVTACADGDRERALNEVADLYYHMMVALRALDAGLDDLKLVLAQRQ